MADHVVEDDEDGASGDYLRSEVLVMVAFAGSITPGVFLNLIT